MRPLQVELPVVADFTYHLARMRSVAATTKSCVSPAPYGMFLGRWGVKEEEAMFVDILRIQVDKIFRNIDLVFDDLAPETFSERIGGFLVWKQMYHLLHSLDKNLIDPSQYIEPPFQETNLDVIYLDLGTPLSTGKLLEYYEGVKKKTLEYTAALNDSSLTETVRFNSLDFSKLQLILAQIQHVYYHVGYLHCCIKMTKGWTPEYVGLYTRVPD